ncbi:flagellar protein FlaG [Lysinibacillus sp.]|uniref:flagellar protein FlaG n=1 Tax=Lysinibacillus sp. TaxID=1869345 RepID=UPI002897E729|nr:flagellar protein FlaG [Lysinibacillus sp.]
MRIVTQGQSIDTVSATNNAKTVTIQENTELIRTTESIPQIGTTVGEERDISPEKLQQAVDAINDFLNVNYSSSKFVYHEDLGQYYVTVVNQDTDEIVKEIPPKKLLDAFYEMQKMVGMIVDEKI